MTNEEMLSAFRSQNAWNIGSGVITNLLNTARMYESWNREDSAVQRRVADLKKAGLSPVLAAGSSASSSGPIEVKNPVDINKMALMQMKQSFASQNADINLKTAEAEKIKTETRGVDLQNDLFEIDKRHRQLNLTRDWLSGFEEYKNLYSKGHKKANSKFGGLAEDILDYFNDMSPWYKKQLDSAFSYGFLNSFK